MRQFRLLPLLLVAACSGAAEQDRLGNATESHDARHDPLNPPPPLAAGSPDGGPETARPLDPTSAEAAARFVHDYFALIGAGRFAVAYRFWSDRGRASGQSVAEFAASFGKYAEYRARTGAPGRPEGAAGSIYVEVPVQVYGRLKSGAQFAETGTVVLRRANDVPGSTAQQPSWRIYRIDLEPTPQPASYRFVGNWATDARNCPTQAWRFTETSLRTPAGSICSFKRVIEVPGGYDIPARCTAESPPTDDVLKLRFAESAGALLFDSALIADAGLVRCR